jgi:hypothetical protein
MLSKEFLIPFDNDMTRVAMLLIFAGAVLIGLIGWRILGWMLVAGGLEVLWLAYHFAVAPHRHELVTDF